MEGGGSGKYTHSDNYLGIPKNGKGGHDTRTQFCRNRDIKRMQVRCKVLEIATFLHRD